MTNADLKGKPYSTAAVLLAMLCQAVVAMADVSETKAYVSGTTVKLDVKSGETLTSDLPLTGMTDVEKNGKGTATFTSDAEDAVKTTVRYDGGKLVWSGNVSVSAGTTMEFNTQSLGELELSGTIHTYDTEGQATGPYVNFTGGGTARYTGSGWDTDLSHGSDSRGLGIDCGSFVFEGFGSHCLARVGLSSTSIAFRNFGRIESKKSGVKSGNIWFLESDSLDAPANLVVTNGVIDKGSYELRIAGSSNTKAGLMQVQAESVVTSAVTIANLGCGAVVVDGGEVMSIGGGIVTSGNDTGRGYLRIKSGEFRMCSNPSLGVSGRAVVEQDGGLFENIDSLTRFGLGDIDCRITGGTFRPSNSSFWFPYEEARVAKSRQHAVMSVSKSGVVDVNAGSFQFGATNGTVIVALNDGGTLRCRRLSSRFSRGAGSTGASAHWYVGADGGRLSILQNGNFNASSNGIWVPDELTVYEGGLILDSSDMSLKSGSGTSAYESNIDMAFKAPRGKSLKTVTLPNEVLDKRYYVPPRIYVEGAGVGAAAYVEIDEVTHKPLGVVVTNPGVGYDDETVVTVDSADLSTTYACQFELEERNSGGLTKAGANTVVLRSAGSTFLGGVVLEGGVLQMDAAGAIPPGNSLALKSGTLELEGYPLTVNKLSGYGKIQAWSSTGIVTITGGVDVAVADLNQGRTIDFHNRCTPVFQNVNLNIDGNIGRLPTDQWIPVMRVTGGNKTFGETLPTLSVQSAKRLKMKLSSDKTELSVRRTDGGMLIYVR